MSPINPDENGPNIAKRRIPRPRTVTERSSEHEMFGLSSTLNGASLRHASSASPTKGCPTKTDEAHEEGTESFSVRSVPVSTASSSHFPHIAVIDKTISNTIVLIGNLLKVHATAAEGGSAEVPQTRKTLVGQLTVLLQQHETACKMLHDSLVSIAEFARSLIGLLNQSQVRVRMQVLGGSREYAASSRDVSRTGNNTTPTESRRTSAQNDIDHLPPLPTAAIVAAIEHQIDADKAPITYDIPRPDSAIMNAKVAELQLATLRPPDTSHESLEMILDGDVSAFNSANNPIDLSQVGNIITNALAADFPFKSANDSFENIRRYSDAADVDFLKDFSILPPNAAESPMDMDPIMQLDDLEPHQALSASDADVLMKLLEDTST